MREINKIIQLVIILLNGAFIGAMLLIALVLVPFWQNSEPQVFLDWFTTYSNSIGQLMIPLGPGVLVLALAALILNKQNRWLWLLTVVFTLGNILYFPIYYLPTNDSFSQQTIALADVSGELSNWLEYHWQRIFFAIGALITSVFAVIKSINTNNKF